MTSIRRVLGRSVATIVISGAAIISPITYALVTATPAHAISCDGGLTANDDSYHTAFNTPVKVIQPIFDNDTWCSDGSLAPLMSAPSWFNWNYSITANPSHGTVVTDGSPTGFNYVPNAGFSGTDTFQYTITEQPEEVKGGDPTTLKAAVALASSTATVTITVDPAPTTTVEVLAVTTVKPTTTTVQVLAKTGIDGSVAPIGFGFVGVGGAVIAMSRRRLKHVR